MTLVIMHVSELRRAGVSRVTANIPSCRYFYAVFRCFVGREYGSSLCLYTWAYFHSGTALGQRGGHSPPGLGKIGRETKGRLGECVGANVITSVYVTYIYEYIR